MTDLIDEAKSHKGRRRILKLAVALLLIAPILLASSFYRPPLAVVSPAPAVDIGEDVTLSGIDSERPKGKYLLVAVGVSQPSLLGAFWAFVNPDKSLIPLSSVYPEGISDKEAIRRQERLFEKSRKAAAAAAALAAGLEVKITGKGARVLTVAVGSAAEGKLRPDDVVTMANGQPVALSNQLRNLVAAQPPGTTFDLAVKRGLRRFNVTIKSRPIPGEVGNIGRIGVDVDTMDLDVDLPFDVDFKKRNIGGPSAGLAYALAILDMIDPANISKGKTIAASGTIELDGRVGEVGGLDQKAIAAEYADADLFLVPTSEAEDLKDPKGRVKGVDSLAEALKVLQAA